MQRDPGSKMWRAFLAAQAAGLVAFFFIPDDSWAHVLWQVLVGWTSVAFVFVGVLRHRPPGALAWCLFAIGVLFNASGTLVEGILTKVYGVNEYPTIADLFWVVLYPCFMAGLGLLIRRRTERRDWATLVESGVISTGLGLLAWVLLIKPQAFDPTLSAIGRAAVLVYPLSDIVLLAMMVRLLFSGGTRNAAFRMLLGGLVGLSVSDIGWAVFSHIGQPPGPTAQRLLAMSFQAAYVLVAAAALHPAVRGVAVSGGRRESHLSPLLLIGLTTAVLVPPALLAVEATDKKVGDGMAIALGSTVLCLLVIARLAQLLRQVEAQSRQLRDLATIDELTGLPNRRAWSLDLPATMEHARIEETALAVAMIDLDHFKRFNDTYGHPAGDQLLRVAALNWRAHLRPADRLARYGGEEFIVLLPVLDAEDALAVLERLRVVTPSGQTFSAGVALWDRIESPAQLIARADRALYQAKTSGRNRSVLFSETTAEVPAVQIGGQSGA